MTDEAQGVCPTCSDAGVWSGKLVRPDGSYTYEFDVACPQRCPASVATAARRQQERVDRAWEASGSPPRYLTASLADFPPALGEAVMAAVGRGKGLYITGTVGTGKTHLQIAVLRALMASGKATLYLPMPDFLTKLRASFNRDRAPQGHETTSALLDAAATVDWLGLDDIGAESSSDWARGITFQVVNQRYIHNRPLIVTTNLTMETLQQAQWAGDRTVSRLREMCDPLTLKGEDWRRRARR